MREELYVTRKKNKGLKAKLQAKYFTVRGWYRSFEDIELNSKRIWGQLKTDIGQTTIEVWTISTLKILKIWSK